MPTLKLYVWYPALEDYTPGAIFVMAHSVKEARALMCRQHGPNSSVVQEMQSKPRVLTPKSKPEGFAIYGGG